MLLEITIFIFLIASFVVLRTSVPESRSEHENDYDVIHSVVTVAAITQEPDDKLGFVPAGTITRCWCNGQFFLQDPVDGTIKNLLHADEFYEDADGKTWSLL